MVNVWIIAHEQSHVQKRHLKKREGKEMRRKNEERKKEGWQWWRRSEINKGCPVPTLKLTQARYQTCRHLWECLIYSLKDMRLKNRILCLEESVFKIGFLFNLILLPWSSPSTHYHHHAVKRQCTQTAAHVQRNITLFWTLRSRFMSAFPWLT